MTKQIVQIKNVKPKQARLGRGRGIQGIDHGIDNLKLRGRDWRATVTDAVLDGEINRTIDGASTLSLTVEDGDRELVRSKLLQAKFDVELDDLWFRYVGLDDGGDTTMTMRFEARDVNRLRQKTGHIKALRNKVTRAEFALMLVREVKQPSRIPFFSPELHVVQPIRSRREGRKSKVEKDQRRGPGLDPKANIKVKRVAASAEQIKNIDRVLDVGMSLRAPRKVLVAAVTCITQESTCMNLGYGDAAGPDSRGLFQQRPSTGWPGDPNDVENAATNFFKRAPTYPGGVMAYNRQHSDADIPTMINAIQRSADASLYAAWISEAQNTVDVYLGGAGTSVSVTTEKAIPYAFERKKSEDSWSTMNRLAEEVKWRCFESNGLLYFCSDDYLMQSRIRMRVGDDQPGIETISANYAGKRKIEEVQITGQARDWAAPPGSVAVVEGRGKADGRYLVHEIRSNLFDDAFEATIRRPAEALPEPPPETKSITRKYQTGEDGGGRTGDRGGATAGELSKVNLHGNTSPGSPWWGGTWPIFKQFVIPFLKDQGLGSWTGKRGYNTGDGVSDHYTGSTSAFAGDFGTYNGESAARALASAMGYGSWSPDSYTSFSIRVDGLSFSVQILWGAGIDHGDHVHVGIHRA